MGEGVCCIDPGGWTARCKPSLQETPKFALSLSRLEEGLRKLSANLGFQLRALWLSVAESMWVGGWNFRESSGFQEVGDLSTGG